MAVDTVAVKELTDFWTIDLNTVIMGFLVAGTFVGIYYNRKDTQEQIEQNSKDVNNQIKNDFRMKWVDRFKENLIILKRYHDKFVQNSSTYYDFQMSDEEIMEKVVKYNRENRYIPYKWHYNEEICQNLIESIEHLLIDLDEAERSHVGLISELKNLKKRVNEVDIDYLITYRPIDDIFQQGEILIRNREYSIVG